MEKKRTLVIGASENPDRYSYLAVQKLTANQHPVLALGVKKGTIGNIQIETEQKPFEQIDTVTLYINPARQKEYYDYILALHPKRIIFNPGTENEEFYELARQKGLLVQQVEAMLLLGNYYGSNRELNKAYEQIQNGIALSRKHNFKDLEADLLLGLSYLTQTKPDSTKLLIAQAANLAWGNNLFDKQINVLSRKVTLYATTKPDSEKSYFLQGLSVARKSTLPL